ncbi:MAG: tRNA dimethylallyltransferase [Lentisphaeria bacterium]|jgi:tRNA dimethylallyltransferase
MNHPEPDEPEKPLAIAIMGPTASGKTDLAIALHEKLGAEIISVDSTLVYRGMDIGTAKPSPEELARAPHRLINIRDPAQPYSAADFCTDASREVDAIVASGKTPLLVGGTMLYFKVLLEGLSPLPVADATVRQEIEMLARSCGWPHVHGLLAKIDAKAASAIHPNHSQRISRAYEVYLLSGRPMSESFGELEGGLYDKCRWVQFALVPRDRKLLHARIALRFSEMLKRGFIDEVRLLKDRGDLHEELPAIRAVGYRQAWAYLNGDFEYSDFVDKGLAATRQLAKRQLTWLRSWPEIKWVEIDDKKGEMKANNEIISNVLKILDKSAI